MEIKVEVPLLKRKTKRISVDESFLDDLKSFIDKFENEKIEDIGLKEKILKQNINTDQFEEMCRQIKIFSSYDENKDTINFPYENWIDRLLEKYE